jgi:cysteinyl-tRNA synthetase
MSQIRLFNTLSRRVELLKPIKRGKVGLYTCGPTVYNFAHLGNFRTFIFEDILERALEWNGYDVKRVMNITDVGHLTGDSDMGDDKIEKEAVAERKTIKQIVSFYTKAFIEDAKKLNIRIPKILEPASKFVTEQIAIIKVLIKKGYAYDTPNAVYFDVSKFKNYHKLSGQKLDQKTVGARSEVVTDDEKRNPQDFVLWFKLTGKFRNHLQRWPSPWGEGFPGWHIECSAISRHFLGQPFDIHTGGVDHIGTHHANEIAQSETAYGKPLAHFWLHGEFLLLDNAKMAKSENNFLTVKLLNERDINPLTFRYLTLTAHYRTPLNFSWVSLEQAKNSINALVQRLLYVQFRAENQRKVGHSKEIDLVRNKFLESVNNDLNIPQALAVTQNLLHDKGLVENQAKSILELIYEFDKVFGLSLKESARKYSIKNLLANNAKLAKLVKEREYLRAHQQFIQSDSLRKKINSLGYIVEDTPVGQLVLPKL